MTGLESHLEQHLFDIRDVDWLATMAGTSDCQLLRPEIGAVSLRYGGLNRLEGRSQIELAALDLA